MDADALDTLREQRLLAVIRAPSTQAAIDAAVAVAKGGIRLVEITYSVPDAPAAIRELAGRSDMVVGVGTALTPTQARDALSAGARFLVAPNFNPDVATIALGACAMYIPGAYTTTEMIAAHAAGAHVMKVYPVGVTGGPAYIRVVREPLGHIPMLAAGGTSIENTVEFLAAGCIGVGLGASLADPALAAAGRFDEITDRARAFMQRVGDAVSSGTLAPVPA
jgi:2-dehydro-3-deoxyphosphogluconate aldolase/(4S)-4-hydroxy-2-oxoglutarate aldolase